MAESGFHCMLAQGALMRQEHKITGAIHAFTQVLGSNASRVLNPLSMFKPVMKNYVLQV